MRQAFERLRTMFGNIQAPTPTPNSPNPKMSRTPAQRCPLVAELEAREDTVQPVELDPIVADFEQTLADFRERHEQIAKTIEEANDAFAVARRQFTASYAEGRACYPEKEIRRVESALRLTERMPDTNDEVEWTLQCADRLLSLLDRLSRRPGGSAFVKIAIDDKRKRITSVRSRLTDLSYQFPIAFDKAKRLMAGVSELKQAAPVCGRR